MVSFSNNDIALTESTIRGVVLKIDGSTPKQGIDVKLWKVDQEKTIFNTKTDKDGVFVIPKLTEGGYYITIGQIYIDAFFHNENDPNYTYYHWALYGNLKNRITSGRRIK